MPKTKPGAVKPKLVPSARYPSGQPEAEPQKGKPPALIKRVMDHAVKLGADRRAATELGRLHMMGILTDTEFEAANRYAEIRGQYEHIKGMPQRTAASPSYERGWGATGLDLDALKRMDPYAAEQIERKIKRRHKAIIKRFNKASEYIPVLPRHAADILIKLTCEDEPIHSEHHAGVKFVLRQMAEKAFRIPLATAAGAPKPQKRVLVSDTRLLAESACDAMADWFKRERVPIEAFDVQETRKGASTLICYGTRPDTKATINHLVEVALKGRIQAEMDAQLVKAAQAKGWLEACNIRRSA